VRPQKQASAKKYFWSDQEHLLFLKLQDKYGKDWKLISEQIEGRCHQQVRTHAQKYYTSLITLKKDALKALENKAGTDFYIRLNRYLSDKSKLLTQAPGLN